MAFVGGLGVYRRAYVTALAGLFGDQRRKGQKLLIPLIYQTRIYAIAVMLKITAFRRG